VHWFGGFFHQIKTRLSIGRKDIQTSSDEPSLKLILNPRSKLKIIKPIAVDMTKIRPFAMVPL
jgi:hypothetical protein